MNNAQQNSYKIRHVVNLTGVSEFVLRAWENRYHAFDPVRTSTGRRLYSKNDVMKARLLFELTEQNHKISEIASLTLQQLKDLSGKNLPSDATPTVRAPNGVAGQILVLAHHEKWDELQLQMSKLRKKKSAHEFIYEIILPLLSEIGNQVAQKKLSVAQEHILSAFIKEHLYLLRKEGPAARSDLRLVLAGQEGDFHELGLLIALVLASHFGIKTLFLGANVPKRELCETCIKFKATHLLLSSTLSKKEGAKEEILSTVQFIDEHLPQKTTLWIVGRNTSGLNFGLKRNDQIVKSFNEFETLIRMKKI